MVNNEEVRVFLESPKSLTLIDPSDIKCNIQSVPRQQPPRKHRRKRRESLPPYIPYKSIYAQEDLSLLTERQRIMALKFQTNKDRVSSLFLEVNGIYLERNLPTARAKVPLRTATNSSKNAFAKDVLVPNEAYIKHDETFGPGEISESDSIKNANPLAPCNENSTLISTKRILVPGNAHHCEIMAEELSRNIMITLQISPYIVRLPAQVMLQCTKCKADTLDLLNMLVWLADKHDCQYKYQILSLYGKVFSLSRAQSCICVEEDVLYRLATILSEQECCFRK